MQYRRAGGTESSMQYFKENVPGVEQLYTESQAGYTTKRKYLKTQKIEMIF